MSKSSSRLAQSSDIDGAIDEATLPEPAAPALPRQLQQRWQIGIPDPDLVETIAATTDLPLLLAQVLVNHGIDTPEAALVYLNPEDQQLPSPLAEFPDLEASVGLLADAIAAGSAIAICGDYDADGMTSTALLLRALRSLGATIDYAIPSRMQEGYGINQRIVEDFAAAGVAVIITVDNGIAAYDPVARARELGLAVIITDHHDLPPTLPPANAILNPKLLAEESPYRGLAGVGVAYVLAVCLMQRLGQLQAITDLLSLFTLGTIADLAPLSGVNRRWVKRGLKCLANCQYPGIQALIQVSGSGSKAQRDNLKPDAIGFRLGPRINAVGRIADPQTVIELLTTDDWQVALTCAAACEQTNRHRQQLCSEIEQAAIAWIDSANPSDPAAPNPQRDQVLVLVQPDWHHGVIGIVASRLVERYGVPVFISTYEGEDRQEIRGSARSIPEFDIFAALQHCEAHLEKFGGHRAAGGYTLRTKAWAAFRSGLIEFAHRCLTPDLLRPLVAIDAQARFNQINWPLFHGIDHLQPCGIDNPEPVFWSAGVSVLEQRVIGQQGNHLKLTLSQAESDHHSFKAMAWRWGEYAPLPERIDIAYRLRDNYWNGETTLELELLGYRPSQGEPDPGQEKRSRLVQATADSPTVNPDPSSNQTNQKPRSSKSVTAKVGEQPAPVYANRPDDTRVTAKHKVDVAWYCPQPPIPPEPDRRCEWFSLERGIESLVDSLVGTLLVYGHNRPERTARHGACRVEYDRPTRPCDVLVLWTLPPSWDHLNWILSLAKPHSVYVRNHTPVLPDAEILRSHLLEHLSREPKPSINLLERGQAWWVAPSTIVSALREMGYPCQGFPKTVGLKQEFQRLEDWYQYPAHLLANLG